MFMALRAVNSRKLWDLILAIERANERATLANEGLRFVVFRGDGHNNSACERILVSNAQANTTRTMSQASYAYQRADIVVHTENNQSRFHVEIISSVCKSRRFKCTWYRIYVCTYGTYMCSR